jgi:CheY-like chemotaxis protein
LYTIFEARNGVEGWNQILSLQPDLIVSDIMMPEMNGIDLCAKIKSDERVSHIPVILLTARSSEEQRLEGFKTGADIGDAAALDNHAPGAAQLSAA